MKKQIFTQEQAHEMFESICHFNDDYSHVDFKKKKRKSIIDYAYITGFRRLEEKIDKEIKAQKQ